jgi:hypothetical protein
MKLLRLALYVHAALWGACGAIVALAPRFALVTVFDQVPYPDYGYVRTTGVMSIGLAMLMVLVIQGSEDRWWWSWAFVLVDLGVVVVALGNALGGSPDGSAAGLWWLFASVTLALGLALVAGLAKTGTERPPV